MKNFFLIIFIICFSCGTDKPSQVSVESSNRDTLIAMVMKDGKYGYINTQGDYIIEPKYPLARSFSNGVACVNFNGVRNEVLKGAVGGSYAFIDTKGQIMFDGKTFSKPLSFYNNYATIELPNRKMGFIDKDLNLVADGFDILMPFREGLATAMSKSENVVGFIDTSGEWKIKLDIMSYTIGDFHEGMAMFMKDNKFGYLDKQGEIAIQPIYEGTYDFHEGLGAFLLNGTYGFLDKEGKVVINNVYQNVADFSDGLCAVQKNGKWGYIDTQGKEVIPFEFDAARDFKEGFASAMKDGKIGFIDKKGDWLAEPNLYNALDFKNGYAIINKNGKLGFINRTGEIVIEPIYDRVDNFVDPNESNENLRMD